MYFLGGGSDFLTLRDGRNNPIFNGFTPFFIYNYYFQKLSYKNIYPKNCQTCNYNKLPYFSVYVMIIDYD